MVRYIRSFFNGVAFGMIETVPGVSGGTIAIILGFYYELIEAVNHFREDKRKYLKFLVPLLLGTASGILLFGSIINFLLTNYSLPTMFFFIGLIVGIIPLIYLKIKPSGRRLNAKEIALVGLPVLLLLVISNLGGVSVVNPAEVIGAIGLPFMGFILVAGIVAAAALVIPGISGSFVLLLLGIYPLATYSISSIRHWLADITNIPLFLDICKVLGPLGVGVIIGGLSMARLIEKLLNHYHTVIYSIILGLLAGSVYVLFNEPIVFHSGVSAGIIATGVVTFVLGCITSYKLGKKKL